jgi:hypothetical protein
MQEAIKFGFEDQWTWIVNKPGEFTVKSCYDLLLSSYHFEGLNDSKLDAIRKL